MKKIIVLIVFVGGIATSGYSQFIKQGTIITGGSFEFRSHKDKDSDFKQSGLSLMPWAGFMVIDNFAVGGVLDVSTGSTESGGSKSTSSDISIAVARYYLDNGLFAHGQFTVGSGKDESGSFVQKRSLSELKVGAGYAIRITDSSFLNPSLVTYLKPKRIKILMLSSRKVVSSLWEGLPSSSIPPINRKFNKLASFLSLDLKEK